MYKYVKGMCSEPVHSLCVALRIRAQCKRQRGLNNRRLSSVTDIVTQYLILNVKFSPGVILRSRFRLFVCLFVVFIVVVCACVLLVFPQILAA